MMYWNILKNVLKCKVKKLYSWTNVLSNKGLYYLNILYDKFYIKKLYHKLFIKIYKINLASHDLYKHLKDCILDYPECSLNYSFRDYPPITLEDNKEVIHEWIKDRRKEGINITLADIPEKAPDVYKSRKRKSASEAKSNPKKTIHVKEAHPRKINTRSG